jgi:glutaredoxin
MTHAPRLELLWWDGCPSTDRALTELQVAAAELGLENSEIDLREIRTEEEAAAAGFIGSPTILVDGIDVVADGALGEATGLTCRVYRRRDGRISPTPDPADLRAALTGADHAEP